MIVGDMGLTWKDNLSLEVGAITTNEHNAMSNASSNSNTRMIILKYTVDFMAVIFLFYPAYFLVWGHYYYHPSGWDHPQIQLILLLADLLPCVFGLVWLLYRYAEAIDRRFPFIMQCLKKPKYHALIYLVLISLVVLAKTFWR
jgi:hypothetical protein